jgi:hypothetical protein
MPAPVAASDPLSPILPKRSARRKRRPLSGKAMGILRCEENAGSQTRLFATRT